MGEVQLDSENKQVRLYADIFLYGNAATQQLATIVGDEIRYHWNAPNASIRINNEWHVLSFVITALHTPLLTEAEVQTNINPRNNYFRVEEYVRGNISYVDGINSNTGMFKRDNLLNGSTTAAHEFGHTLGLVHPAVTDIRGKGQPAIMYPRGTLVDPQYQYDPTAEARKPGGTMNPSHRKVFLSDIADLRLHALPFNDIGFAVQGDFSSVWHEADQP
jgi:hypothetical protein